MLYSIDSEENNEFWIGIPNVLTQVNVTSKASPPQVSLHDESIEIFTWDFLTIDEYFCFMTPADNAAIDMSSCVVVIGPVQGVHWKAGVLLMM